MMHFIPRPLLAFALCCTTTGIPSLAQAQAQAQGEKSSDWNKVWRALQAPHSLEPLPASAAQDGSPALDGKRVLFRFRAPLDATRVYLAGSFNEWARNNGGRIRNNRFAMYPAGGGLWYKWLEIQPQIHHYKYVVEKNGTFQWSSDPHGKETDADGNTRLDVSGLKRVELTSPTVNGRTAKPQRVLKPFLAPAASPTEKIAALDVRFEKTWVRPDQANALLLAVEQNVPPGARLNLEIRTPFGGRIHASSQPHKNGENRIPVPALKREGGFVAQVTLLQEGRIVARGETVLTVVRNVADDLRYGFFTSFGRMGEDYNAKAAMLARLHVNAVEYYDYFPGHGYYAPREAQYKFEPFGISINALDVQRKIEAGHKRNILSLAYVAAYAASESVYRQHPYPMTDSHGIPKVYNGSIMSAEEADRQNKPKWFWLMNVADDSPWHTYIMSEFQRVLDDAPGDLVSFDGFEIDTYGDNADTRFYATGSRRNGDLLSDVLRDFVRDVQSLTHKEKPHGLVSFNSVNEFGVEQMYDVTDFLFLEIWRGHTDRLENLVDICFYHRAPRSQRVILKVYPADMNPKHTVWPAGALRRVLGATMTGAGSLMVVGEPDESKGEMHALNTLYYPDHRPIPPDNEALLRDYYRHDALLLGYTHGRAVVNTDLEQPVPDCITRTYAAPEKRALVVQLLHTGTEKRWSVEAPLPAPKVNTEVLFDLPGGVAPRNVLFASPDVPALHTPIKLDFEVADGKLRTLLPELQVHGTLILQYE